MLSQSIWWSGIALDILLLVRAFRGRLAFQYPVFYGYISFILLQELVRFVVYEWHPQLYPNLYWTTEFVGMLLGCAVVFEIYRLGLSSFQGTARMARKLLAFVYAIALLKAIAGAWNDPRWWVEAATTDIEGALRAIQAVAIVALIALFLSYSIPFGKNLRGILLGYGFFVAWNVASLPLVSSAGSRLHHVLSSAYPICYLFVLSFWLVHLWSYQRAPQPQTNIRLEQDYQSIAAATRRRLQGARGYLAKAVRP